MIDQLLAARLEAIEAWGYLQAKRAIENVVTWEFQRSADYYRIWLESGDEYARGELVGHAKREGYLRQLESTPMGPSITMREQVSDPSISVLDGRLAKVPEPPRSPPRRGELSCTCPRDHAEAVDGCPIHGPPAPEGC